MAESRTPTPTENPSAFRTTRWTILHGLRDSNGARRRRALESLSRQYWKPIYAILRRRGSDPDSAAELTQQFFADVVFQRALFERAEEARGRLRSLLLTALNNYVADDRRRKRRHRRNRMDLPFDALEREERLLDQESASSPERDFERRWAIVQLEEALRRCREHFHETSLQRHWHAFELSVLRPAISGNAAPPPTRHRRAVRLPFRDSRRFCPQGRAQATPDSLARGDRGNR